jgi:hypothetical protein
MMNFQMPPERRNATTAAGLAAVNAVARSSSFAAGRESGKPHVARGCSPFPIAHAGDLGR